MSAPLRPTAVTLEAIHAVLPQTQCTSCGFPDCFGYAQAMAQGEVEINLCPPGGADGIARLAALTGRPVIPLNPEHGVEGPRFLAVIDEQWCIGCTLCIKACPVDCIVGANQQMHTVVEQDCTGCELCLPACPVDCISLVPVHDTAPPPTGWNAWSAAQAQQALTAYEARQQRRQQQEAEQQARLDAKARHKLAHLAELTRPAGEEELARKRSVVEAAMARARARRQPG